MRKTTSGLLFSPSDLIRFMGSPYASWMQRLHLERPELAEPDPEDEQLQMLARKGDDHEQGFLEQLRKDGRDVCVIDDAGASWGERREATAAAIRAGREVIFQGVLAVEGFQGASDFLVRTPAAPEAARYEVWDTKLARRAKPYFLVQLCSYAEMLEPLQGARPEEVAVVLGTGEVRRFRTDDHFFYYQSLKQAFLAQMGAFNAEVPPEPDPSDGHGVWQSHADRWFEATDHLCRVAGISRGQIRRLAEAGVSTLTELARTPVTRVRRMQDDTFARLREQAALQLDSAGLERPLRRVVEADPEGARRGLAALPPPSPMDVFFDMEGYPLVEGGLEYLFGASYRQGDEVRFMDWWAHDEASEKAAFEGFVDWVMERWRADRTMHVYHYAPYEVTALRRLMGRYGTREEEVDEMLRHEVLVDLYAVVRQGVRVGEPSYSIKNLERLYRGARQGAVTDAGASMVYYERWLESGQPADWRRSPILEAIRDYNRDDCDSTLELADWLRAEQRAHGIEWAPAGDGAAEPPAERELSPEVQARIDLAESLLAGIPADLEAREADSERWRVQELLAHLIGFHRREEKPAHWRMFDRHESSHEQLADDVDCLGDLTRIHAEPPVPIKRSWGFAYSFDPDQDTKLRAESRVFFAQDLGVSATLEELDEDGRAMVKISAAQLEAGCGGAMPDRLSLIPNEVVRAKVIEAAIYDVAAGWHDDGTLAPALGTYLGRETPRVHGHTGGPLLQPGEDLVAGAIRVVSGLDRSTLCIQGPPGSGKTYTAARVIAALLAAGKNVGISSNGHRAILNLMRAVNEAMDGHLSCLKVGGPDDDRLFDECPGARLVGGGAGAVAAYEGGLIGGTAWLFSRDDMAGRLDHLFVDEAGQVSVANLVGMSQSADNLVLLGDQMQLGQPIQGAHPGESGSSVLDYLLQDHATVPDELGLFLPTSYRMHPGVCGFISGAVYEGRLRPEPRTHRRVVRVPAGGGGLVPVEAGILFLPVTHEGNTQASDEEVDLIVTATQELLGRSRTDLDGADVAPLTLDDILYVAPYNMQVRRLRRALPPGARVASVDKFQGQEAPVVIVSLCASPGEQGPRGLSFLLDRNRLNVAVSRAQSLALVVGDPRLTHTSVGSLADMQRVNLLCRLLAESAAGA